MGFIFLIEKKDTKLVTFLVFIVKLLPIYKYISLNNAI